MKRKMMFAVLLSLTLLTNLVQAQPKKDAPQIMSLATASLGGTYYIIGAGLAEILNKNVPGIQVNAVIAPGSVGNPRLVHTKEADMGITNYFSGMNAIRGNKPYDGKLNIAGIGKLQYSILHFVTFAHRKDINTFADLKGKRIAVGPAGGGGIMLFREIAPFWGLKLEDIIPSYVSYADGSEALKDGKVDMNMPHGAPPLEAVTSLAAMREVKLLSLESAKLAAVNEKHPYYEEAVIPAGMYKGVDKDVVSVGIQDIFIIHSGASEDLVYQITKAVFENLEAVRKIHPSIKNLTFGNYRDSLVPLHPGARKFYKERGIALR